MVLRFTGEHTQKVDGKGRMSIPADFRRALEAGDPDWTSGQPIQCKLIYGDHLENALQVYAMADYDKLAAEIEEMDEDEDKELAMQVLITQSETLTVDKDGRVVMPLKRREKLGLTEGELTFRGRLSFFEIWKAETYAEVVTAAVQEQIKEKAKGSTGGFNPLRLVRKK